MEFEPGSPLDRDEVIDAEFEVIKPAAPTYGPGVMFITNLIVGVGALAFAAWAYPLLSHFFQRWFEGN